MNYQRYCDAKAFYSDVFPVLLRHEAQNSLPLGNVVLGNKGGCERGWKRVENWYMAAVGNDGGEIILVAIMTPPFNITLYERGNIANDDALKILCENLLKENITVPGVLSSNDLAKRFADEYTARANKNYAIHQKMRIYTLEKVSVNIPQIGYLKKAEEKDLYFLPYWYNEFNFDCGFERQSLEEVAASVKEAIEGKMLFVLEDGGVPVSMASAAREIVNGRRVAMVYTPPYFRNKGYASSCVAKVSQIVLDMGCKYVTLFTDLSNPISNSIYQKIGYKPVCDNLELVFTHKD